MPVNLAAITIQEVVMHGPGNEIKSSKTFWRLSCSVLIMTKKKRLFSLQEMFLPLRSLVVGSLHILGAQKNAKTLKIENELKKKKGPLCPSNNAYITTQNERLKAAP